MQLDMADLGQHIHNLPQELQDIILDHTLVAASGMADPIIIDKNHRPPWQLSLTRVSRQKYASIYYSQAIFTWELDTGVMIQTIIAWLSSLPADHVEIIRNLHLSPSAEVLRSIAGGELGVYRMLMQHFTHHIANAGIQVEEGTMKMPYSSYPADGRMETEWVSQARALELMNRLRSC